MNDAIRMQISAFVDGELPDNEADLLLRRMSQDAELRRKAAEYLAIGRLMRGEGSVPGADRLNERIAEAIGGRRVDDIPVASEPAATRSVRPLAGVAVAASVALVGIFALQYVGSPGEPPDAAGAAVATSTPERGGYTVPQQIDIQLQQYNQSHGDALSQRGNGINARLVALDLTEEALEDAAKVEDPVDNEEVVPERDGNPGKDL